MTALPHEAPSVTVCGYPTQRAREGPCEYESCGQAGWLGRHYKPASHRFLGPVLARCGHPESEHHPEQHQRVQGAG